MGEPENPTKKCPLGRIEGPTERVGVMGNITVKEATELVEVPAALVNTTE